MGIANYGHYESGYGQPDAHRIDLAVYHIGRNPFLLRLWPEWLWWRWGPKTANRREESATTLFALDRPPSELAEFEEAIHDLALVQEVNPIAFASANQAIGDLKGLFRAMLAAAKTKRHHKLQSLLFQQDDNSWLRLKDAAKKLLTPRQEQNSWLEIGRMVGVSLFRCCHPEPKDLMPDEIEKLSALAEDLRWKEPVSCYFAMKAFLDQAAVLITPPYEDWGNAIHRAGQLLVEADAAIRRLVNSPVVYEPLVVLNIENEKFTWFGQEIRREDFRAMKIDHTWPLFCRLAEKPGEFIGKEAWEGSSLSSYVSHLRNILRPAAVAYAERQDDKLRRSAESAFIAKERNKDAYKLDIEPQRVRRADR